MKKIKEIRPNFGNEIKPELEPTNTSSDIKIEFEQPIQPLELGIRHEVDVLVAKLNEIIKKIN